MQEPIRVLVVKDDVALTTNEVQVLSDALPEARVEAVYDGSSAWEYLTRTPVDVVLCDVNAVELLHRIRSEKHMACTSVILVTGVLSPEALSGLLDQGADDCLLKPIKTEELIARVWVALKRARQQRELQAKARELEHQYARVSEFLSWVSHEIRTPLSALISAAHILRRYGRQRPEEVERFAQVIHREGQRLTRLINNLLDLAKIEAGQVDWHWQEMRLQPILAQVREVFTALCSDKSLRLELIPCPDITVRVDQDKLSQVLTNLVSNAIKHSPPNGVIRLSNEAGDASVRIAVEDQGPGVPAGMEEAIFERFRQLDLTDERGGTGLGLAISKEIVTKMGGKIWVERSSLGGARFVIELPKFTGAGA
ncbi:MAG: hybrid sensor histidine kinase/response regulator [Thermoanaerobaculaceae bacterium]